jgi:hypothetical protein
MLSRIVHLPGGPCPPELLLSVAREAGREPDVALGFLPPDEHLRDTLRAMAAAWPDCLRFGCEAVTQFAGAETTRRGTLQLLWFDTPPHHAAVDVVPGTHGEPPSAKRVEAVARRIAAADGALLLVDGLRFPAERFLGDLRRSFQGRTPRVAGGLASQSQPVTRSGARVFAGDRVLPSACLAVTFHGVEIRAEVLRGWSPASPVYEVTRAEGAVVHEIDGASAADWYRRFFTVAGKLAPMPESAYRFPLLIVGPAPERQGLYRTLRSFDDPPGTVTFWGSVETGDRVRLGIGNDRALVELAENTAGLTAGSPPLPPEAAMLYSCVAREPLPGEGAGHEGRAIHQLLNGAALSGFVTFGEIGPTPRGDTAYYNQTAILVLLREVEP